MFSFLSKIKNFVFILLGGCIGLLLLIVLPFAYDTVYNEIRLGLFKLQIKQYAHPPDSKLVQKFSMVGNFAPASNQCGFIVAEIRTTRLKSNEIHTFYTPILTDISYADGPPYHEVNLYLLSDKKDIASLRWNYSEVYERINATKMNSNDLYLLLTSATGYSPNFDIRCH